MALRVITVRRLRTFLSPLCSSRVRTDWRTGAKEEKKNKLIMDGGKTHDWESHGRSDDIDESTRIDKVKEPDVFERAKEEIEALVEVIHPKRSPDHEHHRRQDEKEAKTHHKDTHGTSTEIDENTPTDKVKGPNVFERAKEEIEALVEVIHSKKGSKTNKLQ